MRPDLLDFIATVIDTRSFSGLWYWIMLAVMWSGLSHFILGVPYDMVQRARRGDAQSASDMRLLAEVNANRLLALRDQAGGRATALAGFVHGTLVALGWGYGLEFCQAVFFLLFPMTLVLVLSIRNADRLRAHGFADLARTLRRQRIAVQLLGVVCLFVTTFWGMWVNLNGAGWGL